MRTHFVRYTALAAAVVGLAACGQGAAPVGSCPDDCLLPPASYCENDELVTPLPLGDCVDGTCIYSESRSTCAGSCVSGSCVAEIDNCGDVVCDAPPAVRCLDDVLTTWDATGTCDSETGDCSYTSTDRDCALEGRVCDNGACLEPDSPCLGVVCDAPQAECDGAVAVTYNDGSCIDGTCEYESTRTQCDADDPAGFCDAGRCQLPDRCADVTCDTPPPSSCVDDVSIVQYAATGRCDAGDCSYAQSERSCADAGRVCREGACVVLDECDGVTCDSPPGRHMCRRSRHAVEPDGDL